MGTGKTSRKRRAAAKKKGFKKYFLSTKHRTKDVDQIQDEQKKGGITFEHDDDLPGAGQFYCQETARHFADQEALDRHRKSKKFKKRCKVLKEKQYLQEEADFGAGRTKEVLPPAHPKS